MMLSYASYGKSQYIIILKERQRRGEGWKGATAPVYFTRRLQAAEAVCQWAAHPPTTFIIIPS
jgi:hypothetical protein